MNEHLTADECRNLAAIAKWPVRDINLGAMHRDWLRAAATIEALQAQIPTPMSGTARLREIATWLDASRARVDTDEARERCRVWEKAIRRPYSADESDEVAFVRIIRSLADALDASRAECERLRAELREVRMYGRSQAGMDDMTCGQSLGAGQ